MKILLFAFLSFLVVSGVAVGGVESEGTNYVFRGLVSYYPETGMLAYSGKVEDIFPYKMILFKSAIISDERLSKCKKSEVELVCTGRVSGKTLVLETLVEARSVGESHWVTPAVAKE